MLYEVITFTEEFDGLANALGKKDSEELIRLLSIVETYFTETLGVTTCGSHGNS